MRPDGTRAKNLSAIVQAIPHIMPKRYDAQNWSSELVDDDILRAYIREKRKEDKTVTRMSIMAAAYYKAVLENPNLNVETISAQSGFSAASYFISVFRKRFGITPKEYQNQNKSERADNSPITEISENYDMH